MLRQIAGQVTDFTIRRDGDHWFASFSVLFEPDARPIPDTKLLLMLAARIFPSFPVTPGLKPSARKKGGIKTQTEARGTVPGEE